MHLRLRFPSLGKPRSAGLSEAERGPITGTSLYLVLKSNGLPRPKIRLKKFGFSPKIVPANISKKLPAQVLSQIVFHPVFQLLAQMAHVCLHSESGYTLAFANRIAHSGLHAETGAVSDGGAITTLGAFCAVRKPCVARCQNGVLCRFGILAGRCSRRTQRACGTAMRMMRVAVPQASRPRWAA